MNKQDLIDFELWTVDKFNEGRLRSPVHLSGSVDGKLEDYLIELFKQIKSNDWVATTYRSHYHALLKGVPEKRLKNWILDNKSIHFMDKEYKMFSSAIVGGTLPTALGVALGIKLKCENSKIKVLEDESSEDELVMDIPDECFPNHVWCFIGDMTACTGVFWECWNYAVNFDLPITFIIEDNGLSTDTPTREVWNKKTFWFEDTSLPKLIHYKYERKWPHYGTGTFVSKLWEKENVKSKGF